MAEFVTTKEFKALNVGFSLDEGVASPTQDFIVYNAERCSWKLNNENRNVWQIFNSFQIFTC